MFLLSRSLSDILQKDERVAKPVCPHVRNKPFLALQRQIKVLKLILIMLVVVGILLWLAYKCRVTERRDLGAGSFVSNYLYTTGEKSVVETQRITAKAKIVHYSASELMKIKEELDERRAHLREYCESVKRESTNLENVLPNIIVDREHGISWCPIYKAASSAWMKKFAALGGALTETTINLIRKDVLQVNNIVRQIYPREPDLKKACQRLNETKTFLIVRHPFERLVSAYRDKLENMKGREYYYKRFGRHMAQRYRRFRKANETRIEPTFREFLQFIVDEKYFDEHWAPFFDSCEPCSISYDYILKFESLERDQHLLIRDLDLEGLLATKLDLKNENPRGLTTNAIVEEYKSQVPLELLDKIYKVYRHDFQAFSYENL